MAARSTEAAAGGDREIVLTRLFDAPRALVFDAWSHPRHLAQWWGPNGFSTTTYKMDLKPGGVWRFVMHGPDGRDYQNRITYLEVVRPERLVYEHGGGEDVEPVEFQVSVTFAEQGGKTAVTLRMVFPTPEARDHVVKEYGAVEGGKQTLERLGAYLPEMAKQQDSGAEQSASPVFTITRTLDAPRDLVWQAWSEAEHLLHWWGPKGFKLSISRLEFRPGGVFHYRMESAGGQIMWGRFVYREIVAPERMVFVNSFSDETAAVTRAPFSESWPLEWLTTVTFAEQGGKATVTLTASPINASEEEVKTFEAGFESMRGGFGATFDQLAAYLAKT